MHFFIHISSLCIFPLNFAPFERFIFWSVTHLEIQLCHRKLYIQSAYRSNLVSVKSILAAEISNIVSINRFLWSSISQNYQSQKSEIEDKKFSTFIEHNSYDFICIMGVKSDNFRSFLPGCGPFTGIQSIKMNKMLCGTYSTLFDKHDKL